MISQEKRGGGTIAFQDEVLWDFLSKTDLVQPATGQTLSEAYAQIKQTHVEADKSGQ
jgi:deoxyribonuclease-2